MIVVMAALSYIPRIRREGVALFIYYGMRALVGLAAVIYLWEGDLSAAGGCAFIVVLMSAPSILKERYRLYLPFALDLGIVTFIFGTLFLGHLLSFYELVPLWDKFLHVQSGLILGASGFVVVYVLNKHDATSLDIAPGFVALFAIAFSLSIGTVWEMFEFLGDGIFGSTWQSSMQDTMYDLVADLAGALIVSGGGYLWMRHEARLPLTPAKFREWRERVLQNK